MPGRGPPGTPPAPGCHTRRGTPARNATAASRTTRPSPAARRWSCRTPRSRPRPRRRVELDLVHTEVFIPQTHEPGGGPRTARPSLPPRSRRARPRVAATPAGRCAAASAERLCPRSTRRRSPPTTGLLPAAASPHTPYVAAVTRTPTPAAPPAGEPCGVRLAPESTGPRCGDRAGSPRTVPLVNPPD